MVRHLLRSPKMNRLRRSRSHNVFFKPSTRTRQTSPLEQIQTLNVFIGLPELGASDLSSSAHPSFDIRLERTEGGLVAVDRQLQDLEQSLRSK